MADPPETDGRRVRGARRQRALVDAARDLFIRHGYRGTTLEAIIAQAGGSRETIYRAFGGKRGLFGTIIATVGERLAADAVAADVIDLPPRAGLTRFARNLVEVWQSEEGAAINRVIVSEGLDAPELVDAWYRGGTALSIASLSRYLAIQHEAGRLIALDPGRVARQFMILLIGEMAFPLVSGQADSEPSDQRIACCVDLILRAYETH